MLEDVLDALRRNSPEAVALAREEVAATPGNAAAHHLLGMALHEAGDLPAAAASLDHAIELAPDEALYHFSRARVGWSAGDHAAVERATAHALALDPNQLGAYLLRIQVALATGDHAEAERQYNLAEKVDSENPHLLAIAGQIEMGKGEPQRAIDRLLRARNARPHDPQILTLLGMAYLRQDHPAFAEQVLRNARDLAPASLDARRLLVQALLAQGRHEDAGIELAHWRTAFPHDPGVVLVAAELKLRSGDARGALADARALLALQPQALQGLQMAEQALAAIGDVALARTVWDECLAREPRLDPVWFNRLQSVEDHDDRAQVLRRWRQALPESAAAWLNQARADESDGRDADAEAGYDAVLERIPTHADALFGKAMYEFHRDPALAHARLTALVAMAPSSAVHPVLSIRGYVLDSMDQHEAALGDWLPAHFGLGNPPHDLPLPEQALRALPLPAPVSGGPDPVVLLWGPPGSGSERIAAALLYAPSRPLMQAGAQLLPRIVALPEAFLAQALDPAHLHDIAAQIAAEYIETVEPYVQAGNAGVFDWYGFWDARPVPALRTALPRLRLIAPLRDPRDLLLNWLAFGAPAGPAFVDPMTCAHWLALQLEHLLFSRDVLGLPVLLLDMDRFDADPVAGMQQITDFADLPNAPDPQPAITRRTGPGRIPTALPAGRWQAYNTWLGPAFDVLAPVADRLGYGSASS
ncbi:MAG: tetratricopeptide repeat protein [Proteobacteria bacterium]|nr:tetratricopeptide repeat protein [Pseudomonadota bacterium]